MNLKRLLLIRHAICDELSETINYEGREQVEAVVAPTRTFIDRGRKDRLRGLDFISSTQRRAIDTILFLGDKLGGLGILNTIEALQYSTETSGLSPFYDIIENSDAEMAIAAGHKEFVECFPVFLKRQKRWASRNTQERGYCQGYYFDLVSKEYKLFPEEMQTG